MPDDVASGAYAYLSALPDVLAVVGSFPADDPDNAGVPWIFVRNNFTRMEDVSIVRGTQAVALVCTNMGGSTPPLDYSTARPQRLEIDIWVDPLRDAYGNVTNPSEAQARGLAVYGILDSHLHRAAFADKSQLWGDLVTTNGIRMSEPAWYPVPDGDGLVRGVCFWDITTFGNYDPVVDVSSGETGSGH